MLVRTLLFVILIAIFSSNAHALLCSDLIGPLPLVEGVVAARISSAHSVNAGDEPEHCSVVGELDVDPSDSSVIGFRMKLPTNTVWNEKLLVLGGGGFEGDLSDFSRDRHNNNGISALRRNYAIGVTDTGHTGNFIPQFFAPWALDNPASPGIDNEREINWAYQGTHFAAQVMKSVIERYFGMSARYAYYLGASNSGRTAFIEAGRYPDDFDGIIAASPVIDYSDSIAKFTSIQQAQFPTSTALQPVLQNEKFALINQAVLAKCDALDGITDGLVDDPRHCPFNPYVDIPDCADDVDALMCLTLAQKHVLSTIYQNGVEPSGELNEWDVWLSQSGLPPFVGPNLQYRLAEEFVRYFIKDDPAASLLDFAGHQSEFDLLRLTDAPRDLSPYFDRGGKIITWVGWLDPAALPRTVINYYRQVTREMKPDRRDNFIRLFMVPGQAHGVRPGKFFQGADFLTALERWVELGLAPDAITVKSVDETIERPLCPFPQITRRIDPVAPDPDFANYQCVYPRKLRRIL